MANTAALLGNLLSLNADINWYTTQQIYWSNKYEANAKLLNKQAKYEEKWENAYDSAMDPDKSRNLTAGNITVHKGDTVDEGDAERYANAKVSEYNEELYLELQDLDMEYDAMKTMYDELLTTLRADRDSAKQATTTAAQDTGLLGQGG